MQRWLVLAAVGSIVFGVVTAFAAGLAGIVSTSTLSASNSTVSGCGNASAVSIGYETRNDGTQFLVDKVILTVTGTGSFRNTPTCEGGSASINFGATQVLGRSLSSGDFSADGKTLTLDVADATAGTVTNLAILIAN